MALVTLAATFVLILFGRLVTGGLFEGVSAGWRIRRSNGCLGLSPFGFRQALARMTMVVLTRSVLMIVGMLVIVITVMLCIGAVSFGVVRVVTVLGL